MAKIDFCFTFYDGDAARDVAHMNRLERGGYFDLLISIRKFGHLSPDRIKKILGKDFDECWPAIEMVFKIDHEGLYFIEWLEESQQRMLGHSKKQSENGSKGGRGKAKLNPTESQIKPNEKPEETQQKAESNPTESQIKPNKKPIKNESEATKEQKNISSASENDVSQVKSEKRGILKPNESQAKAKRKPSESHNKPNKKPNESQKKPLGNGDGYGNENGNRNEDENFSLVLSFADKPAEVPIVQELKAMYLATFPHYPFSVPDDSPHLLQLVYRIGRLKHLPDHEVLDKGRLIVKTEFQKILDFVKSDTWFSGRSLSDLVKEWPRLINKMFSSNEINSRNNAKRIPGKPVLETDGFADFGQL